MIYLGPHVQYQMKLEYLAKFFNFIREKYNRGLSGSDDDEGTIESVIEKGEVESWVVMN